MTKTVHGEAILAECMLKFKNSDPNKKNYCCLTKSKLYVFKGNDPPKTITVNKISYADPVSKFNWLYFLVAVTVLVFGVANHFADFYPKPVNAQDFYVMKAQPQASSTYDPDLLPQLVLDEAAFLRAGEKNAENKQVLEVVLGFVLLGSLSTFFKRKKFGIALVADGQRYFFESGGNTEETKNFIANIQKRMGN